ncbi:DEAD/DEAH box helicase [Spraguea lophii 42_110]|uniref:RNA helicase n=1 Tax=Spraguea lophii (strain 42_110) TaxID=1358809 RepID=S7W977_SPRLO|nr:DEAD/DEAH box helicase [Spraguea lophii 42_110]
MARSDDELIEYNDTMVTSRRKTQASHSANFKDFLLRDELNIAIQDAAFEHPSEVQQQCIPKAILGVDILCQAKSGTGKTGVFVISTLQQLKPIDNESSVLVIVHTKEMAYQIKEEYQRFIKPFNGVTVGVFYGGVDVEEDIRRLNKGSPTVFIGTPGRTLDLLKRKEVSFRHVKHLVIDECDQCITDLKLRRDIQEVLYRTPLEKQTMMFTATLNEESKATCLLFLNNPHEVYVGEESRLTLHGLTQGYLKVEETEKEKVLEDILDRYENINQCVIFVKDKMRAKRLTRHLSKQGFPTIDIHSGVPTKERLQRFNDFKERKYRMLVATDLMGRGIDIQDINMVINYDMPESAEAYLHRVGRAGRFETKGDSISFVSDESDSVVLNEVQKRFEVSIKDLKEQ